MATEICSLCGESNFACSDDGLFYCVSCNTQSQSQRSVQTQDDVLERFQGQQLGMLRLKTRSTATGQVASQPSADVSAAGEKPFSPYIMYEVYTFILRSQSRALIKLGVHPAIEDAILRVWIRYLRYSRIAFVKKGEVLHYGPFNRAYKAYRRCRKHSGGVLVRRNEKRLLDLPKHMELGVSNSCMDKPTGSKLESTSSEEEPESNQFNNSQAGQEPESNQFNNSQAGPREAEEIDVDGTCTVWPSSSQSVPQGDDRMMMSMSITISLLHLACLSIGAPVLLSDLLRWVDARLVPFYNVWRTLPEQFQVSWVHQFTRNMVHALSLEAFSGHTRWLCSFTCFPEVSVAVEEVLARFVKDFNLPSCILARAVIVLRQACAKKCWTKYVFKFSRKIASYFTNPPPELRAMAVLIVTLKLLFGLDGYREWLISDLGKERRAIGDGDAFVFAEWMLQLRLRLAIARGEPPQRVLSHAWVDRTICERSKMIDQLVGSLWRSKMLGEDEVMEQLFGPLMEGPNVAAAMSLFPLRMSARHAMQVVREDTTFAMRMQHAGVFEREFFYDHGRGLDFLADATNTAKLRDIVLPAFLSTTTDNSDHRTVPNPTFPCADRYVFYPWWSKTNKAARDYLSSMKDDTWLLNSVPTSVELIVRAAEQRIYCRPADLVIVTDKLEKLLFKDGTKKTDNFPNNSLSIE